MTIKLTRLTHKIAIQLHLVADSCTICNSHCRRSVRKLLDTPSYSGNNWATRYPGWHILQLTSESPDDCPVGNLKKGHDSLLSNPIKLCSLSLRINKMTLEWGFSRFLSNLPDEFRVSSSKFPSNSSYKRAVWKVRGLVEVSRCYAEGSITAAHCSQSLQLLHPKNDSIKTTVTQILTTVRGMKITPLLRYPHH
jgi:hypothetical protein